MRVSVLLPAGGCKGFTRKGQPCDAKNVFQNGYCKHHGGKGESLLDRRRTLKLQLDTRKSERMRKSIDRLLRRASKESPALRQMLEEVRARREAKDKAKVPA
jgi:hypothetical protein